MRQLGLKQLHRVFSSFLSCVLAMTFVMPPGHIFAQPAVPTAIPGVLTLPQPGTMVSTSQVFETIMLKGLRPDPDNPLKFEFFMDHGDQSLKGEAFEAETNKLIKYFLASLTVPEEDLWVNLSPYEADRIIPEEFGVTEMGRDLLAQDYLLKQLTASLLYPLHDIGHEFWNRVYKKVRQKYGSVDMPMNTFNKIWIIPESATVFEDEGGAFVVERHLKVMLEEDYLAMQRSEQWTVNSEQKNEQDNDLTNQSSEHSALITEIIRELLIPEIEKEVNHGKNFAPLRQIMNAMILATWYKKALKSSLLAKVYTDQNKVTGIDLEDKQAKDKIYAQYMQAFKQGVYNLIQEEYDPMTQQIIPRTYFSGGVTSFELENRMKTVNDLAMLTDLNKKELRDSLRNSSSVIALLHEPNEIKTAQPQIDQAMVGDEKALWNWLKELSTRSLEITDLNSLTWGDARYRPVLQSFMERYPNMYRLLEPISNIDNLINAVAETKKSFAELEEEAKIIMGNEILKKFVTQNPLDAFYQDKLSYAFLVSEESRIAFLHLVDMHGGVDEIDSLLMRKRLRQPLALFLANPKTRQQTVQFINQFEPEVFSLNNSVFYETEGKASFFWYYLAPLFDELKQRLNSDSLAAEQLLYFYYHFDDVLLKARVFLRFRDLKWERWDADKIIQSVVQDIVDVIQQDNSVDQAMVVADRDYNYWQREDVLAMAADLEVNGVTEDNFDVVGEYVKARNAPIYKHKTTGVQVVQKIIDKEEGDLAAFQMYIQHKPESIPPIFLDRNDPDIYYILDLGLERFGYQSAEDLFGKNTSQYEESVRQKIMNAADKAFRFDQDIWISHDDLTAEAIMLKLDDSGEVVDVKFIDLDTSALIDLKKYPDLYRYLQNPKENNLRGANLEGLTLLWFNGENIDFTGANFSRSTVLGGSFNGANLSKVNFWQAWIQDVSFREANLFGVSFMETNKLYLDMTGANLQNTEWFEGDTDSINFTNADLAGVDLYGLSFDGVNRFEGANLDRSTIELVFVEVDGVEKEVKTAEELIAATARQSDQALLAHPQFLVDSQTGRITYQPSNIKLNFRDNDGKGKEVKLDQLIIDALKNSEYFQDEDPLIALKGSATYLIDSNGNVQWDLLGDRDFGELDIVVYIPEGLSDVPLKEVKEIAKRAVDSIVFKDAEDQGHSVEFHVSRIGQLRESVADGTPNARELLHPTNQFFGNIDILNNTLNKLGAQKLIDHWVEYYRYIARLTQSSSIPSLKDVKRLYFLAMMSGQEQEFQWILRKFRELKGEISESRNEWGIREFGMKTKKVYNRARERLIDISNEDLRQRMREKFIVADAAMAASFNPSNQEMFIEGGLKYIEDGVSAIILNVNGRKLKLGDYGVFNAIFDNIATVFRVSRYPDIQFNEKADIKVVETMEKKRLAPRLISYGATKDGHSYSEFEKIVGQSTKDIKSALTDTQIDLIIDLLDQLIENRIWITDIFKPGNIMIGHKYGEDESNQQAFAVDIDDAVWAETKSAADLAKGFKYYYEYGGAERSIRTIDPHKKIVAYLTRKAQGEDEQENKQVAVDQAIVSNPVGGIDLNPTNMNLQIKRDGQGVALPVEFQDIESIDIKGFVPVIININPTVNLPFLFSRLDEFDRKNRLNLVATH